MSAIPVSPAVPTRSPRFQVIEGGQGQSGPSATAVASPQGVAGTEDTDDYLGSRQRHPAFRQRELAQRLSAQRLSAPRQPAQRQSAQRPTVQRPTVQGSYVSSQPVALPLDRAALRKGISLCLRTLVYLGIAVAVFSVGIWLGSWGGDQSYQGATVRHSVQPGESLWSIAEGLDVNRPVAKVVEDIRSLNGIEAEGLEVGQAISLPAR